MLAVVIAAMLGACGPSDSDLGLRSTPQDWEDQRTPSGFQRLAEPQPPCQDCLAFERVAVLGDESGPGLFRYSAQGVVVDRHGNFWVGQAEMIKVFEPHGTFLRDIGRGGQGPLEFQSGVPIFSDAHGNVHIFDFMNARETIVGSDFTLVDMRPILQRADRSLSPLPGGRYVTPMWVPTPDRIAYPLHVIEGTEIISSFGIPADAEQKPLTRAQADRLVTTDAVGHIFSIEEHRYLIEAWTVDGIRIMGLQGPRLNDAEFDPELRWDLNGNSPPMGWIFDIRVDDRERLWVLSWQRRENWRDAAVEKISPDGSIALDTVGGTLRGFFRSRIDVIDLETATLIASGTVDEFLTQLLTLQRVLETDLTKAGDWQLAVWEVDLDVRAEGGERPERP